MYGFTIEIKAQESNHVNPISTLLYNCTLKWFSPFRCLGDWIRVKPLPFWKPHNLHRKSPSPLRSTWYICERANYNIIHRMLLIFIFNIKANNYLAILFTGPKNSSVYDNNASLLLFKSRDYDFQIFLFQLQGVISNIKRY